jgi:hypothetical protein
MQRNLTAISHVLQRWLIGEFEQLTVRSDLSAFGDVRVVDKTRLALSEPRMPTADCPHLTISFDFKKGLRRIEGPGRQPSLEDHAARTPPLANINPKD